MDTATFTLKFKNGSFVSYSESVPEDMNSDNCAYLLEHIMRMLGYSEDCIDEHIHYDLTKIQFNSTE